MKFLGSCHPESNQRARAGSFNYNNKNFIIFVSYIIELEGFNNVADKGKHF